MAANVSVQPSFVEIVRFTWTGIGGVRSVADYVMSPDDVGDERILGLYRETFKAAIRDRDTKLTRATDSQGNLSVVGGGMEWLQSVRVFFERSAALMVSTPNGRTRFFELKERAIAERA